MAFPPHFYAKLGLLASLNDKDDITLIRQKYPELASLLIDLAYCEASWKHDGQWGDNYTSYGWFQFKQATFLDYCQGEWKNAEDQLDCAVQMIKADLGPIHWKNCWRIMNLWKYKIL